MDDIPEDYSSDWEWRCDEERAARDEHPPGCACPDCVNDRVADEAPTFDPDANDPGRVRGKS